MYWNEFGLGLGLGLDVFLVSQMSLLLAHDGCGQFID